eukprot:TRINITY_DN6983_c0_g1_i1.p1 TRINITY_DN6983_c0_g1~~TRINITY_DN6983_c0_g1_i1.p1  ORF type:complete len:100 (+),score=7.39 TRINITY_DN6983_c0_g1_i1:1022-1321(+)
MGGPTFSGKANLLRGREGQVPHRLEGGVGLAMRGSIAFVAGPFKLTIIDTATMTELGAVKIHTGTYMEGTVGVAVDGDSVYTAGCDVLTKLHLPDGAWQ